LDGAESEECVPSNIRTFSNTVTAERSCASADAAQMEAVTRTPCASLRKVRRLGVLIFFLYHRSPGILSLSEGKCISKR
jgi:hypothetical protein